MKPVLRITFLISITLLFSFNIIRSQPGTVNLHYLGHASFVMDFNDFTVLTDFGTSYCWGLNSPIYDIGTLAPTVMSYSHYHMDHYDESRVPAFVPFTIDLLDTLNLMNLWVYPVRTCETNPGVESNTSFTFDFMGYRILHLGDAQAEIMNIDDPDQQALFLEKFPDRIDLLLMTIEGVYPFIPEAEKFIDLIQPGMVIPMHYWSPEYKEEFLDYLELQNDTAGKNYEVHRLEGPHLNVAASDTIHDHIIVYGLSPYPYGETGMEQNSSNREMLKAYPNPFRNHLNISFFSPVPELVHCNMYDYTGREVISPFEFQCNAGANSFMLRTGELRDGIYLVQLKSIHLGLRKAYVVRRGK